MNAKSKERARAKRLMDNYKLTVEEFDKILAHQGGVCYVCGQPEPVKGRRLSVDHDWVTGLIRGLLCSRCNPILGKIERAFIRYGLAKLSNTLTMTRFLLRIAGYLQSPPATNALKREHFGYKGRIGTKSHRKRIKKEQKTMLGSEPLLPR